MHSLKPRHSLKVQKVIIFRKYTFFCKYLYQLNVIQTQLNPYNMIVIRVVPLTSTHTRILLRNRWKGGEDMKRRIIKSAIRVLIALLNFIYLFLQGTKSSLREVTFLWGLPLCLHYLRLVNFCQYQHVTNKILQYQVLQYPNRQKLIF